MTPESYCYECKRVTANVGIDRDQVVAIRCGRCEGIKDLVILKGKYN